MKKIGFIGLGQMGGNIAKRLLSQGYEIGSIKRGRYKEIKKKSINFKVYDNVIEVGNNYNIIISCTNTVENLLEITIGKNGIINSKNKPKFFLDFGTGKPSVCLKIKNSLKKKGIKYFDMPIGRTPKHALEGKINLFSSGSEKKLIACKSLLNTIAENIFHFDNIGEGTKIKLINNFYGQSITLLFSKLLDISKYKKVNNLNLLKVMEAGPLGSNMLSAITNYSNGYK